MQVRILPGAQAIHLEPQTANAYEHGARDYPGVYLTMILDNGEQHPRVSGVELDRSGINRLIATLRKARDQTFGADE